MKSISFKTHKKLKHLICVISEKSQNKDNIKHFTRLRILKLIVQETVHMYTEI
jgi:hypothetical protein